MYIRVLKGFRQYLNFTKKTLIQVAKTPVNIATGSSIKHQSTKYHSLEKVENAPSANPNKRGEILTTLAKKYQMQIAQKDKLRERFEDGKTTFKTEKWIGKKQYVQKT